MWKILENKITFAIFIVFLLFYTLQIPLNTYNADVLAFAIRSAANSPIIDYAYLNSTTLLSGESLPNYHLGHTIILWIVYQLVPQALANSIWPAGFISAISGALSVLLTYLIWLNLGINKRRSVFIAITFGLIPTFWEHSIIGEVYSLQMLFILLFLYNFIKQKYIYSTISFLIANLISPLSGLTFILLFLKGFNKRNFSISIYIGGSALFIYILIFYMLGADLLMLITPVSHHPSERGIIYRIATLGVFVILNFGFFLYYFKKGTEQLIKENRPLLMRIILTSIPQFLLVFVSAGFFIEYGSFQIILFWSMAVPIGYYISGIKFKSFYFIFSLFISLAITISLWLNPHRTIGASLEEAGNWLNNYGYDNVCLIGPWDVGLNILSARNGMKLESLHNFYFDNPHPSDIDLLKTNKKNLIIVTYKKISLRKILSDYNIPGLIMEDYNPINDIESGVVNKLFENNFVCLYSWKK